MILITLQYIPVNFDTAFLSIKQSEITHKYYQISFFSHVYTSFIILITGIPQFSTTIRRSYQALHKFLGKAYIFLIIFIAGPSGLIMGVHANGGLSAKISFVLQAILWMAFTSLAFYFIRKKQWQEHEKFMIRSYALTLSAVSLRLIKWLIVSTIQLPPMDTYKIVAWAGWLINILIAEFIIWRKFQSKGFIAE
ncbi:DUF2306 domain-containing protein [Flammeovirgaceae bacterium KN852]|uniref:DUF2306 domain-containing protein n=2 Tax=Marinigracilibium pacificum TaxID=2729599 RepID=A0A848J0D6_9BACT|nr:DUF2306 domain-containing protein [Marinigracilibium pacificum]